jgi:flavodoxin
MKATIIYHSKTGTTAKYAENIKLYLKNKGIEAEMSSIKYFENKMLENTDYLFIGCWTSGLFFFMQHPEKEWVEFAQKLNVTGKPKIALFTTYKLLTGSMFTKMLKYLKSNFKASPLTLKSKYGELSESDKLLIDRFVN